MEGRNSANAIGPEILLYLAGERQLTKAIERAGIRPGLERVVVLVLGYRRGAATWDLLDRLGWSKDPAGLHPNPRTLERMGLVGLNGHSEAAVLEQVALVDVRK